MHLLNPFIAKGTRVLIERNFDYHSKLVFLSKKLHITIIFNYIKNKNVTVISEINA